jgi:predicted TIM-barrel fold metal-dependent hydrolase
MNYRYISGDSHMEVDTANWTPRVPEKYRERAPKLVRLDNGMDAWFIDGKQSALANAADLYGGKGRENYLPRGAKYEGTPGTGTPQQRMEEQAMDGVDAEVLFPAQATGPKMWRKVDDNEAYLTIVRAYNDWLIEDYCSANPDRLIGVGLLPMIEDLDAHIAELMHCKQQGFKAVMLGDFPSGKSYPTKDDDRFWATALELEMPVTVHVDLQTSAKGPFLEYPKATPELLERLEAPGRSFPEQVARFGPSRGSGALPAAQWVLSGVFDRFPDLKILFAENQIGWLPFYLQGADVRYERNRYWAENLLGFTPLSRPPSEYLMAHTLWGFQYDRVGVQIRELLNVDHLIWGSDFPHQESDWPNSMEILDRAFDGAPEDIRYKMTCGNAIDFFKLNAN